MTRAVRGVILTVATIVTALALAVLSGPLAAGQDLEEVPAIEGVTGAGAQNDYQEHNEECRESDGGLLGNEGTAEWLRESAHAGGFREAITAPGRAMSSGYCMIDAAVSNPGDAVATAAESASSAFWGDPIGDFVRSLLEGNAQALMTLMTIWTAMPFDGQALDNSVGGVMNMTWQLQFLLLAISLMIAGTRMAAARNKGLGDGAEETGRVMFTFIISATALPVIVMGLHRATDMLSAQWLELGMSGSAGESIAAIAKLDEETGLGPALALIFVLWALLGALAQFIALVVREGLLVIVVGLIPLAAAASALGAGRQTYKGLVGFVVAALLFKPVATLIYVVAFWLASSSPGEEISVLTAISSLILLGAAGLTLPAIMRLVAPVAMSAGGGGSAAAIGGMAGGVAGGAMGAVSSATGAMSSTAGGGSPVGGSGSSGGAGGATGAVGPGGGGGPSGGGGSPAGSGGGGGRGPSGAGGGTSRGGSAGEPSGGGAGSGVSGAMSGVGRGASAAGGAALGAAGAAVAAGSAVTQSTARMTQSTESMIEGAMGSYHGQVR